MPTSVTTINFDTTAQAAINKPRIYSVIYTYSDYTTVNPANAIGLTGGFLKILGSGFSSNEQVFIRGVGNKGSTLALSVTYISSSQLNCSMPASTAGTKMLYVVNLDGATAISSVTYKFVL